jgi:hypothetical protein
MSQNDPLSQVFFHVASQQIAHWNGATFATLDEVASEAAPTISETQALREENIRLRALIARHESRHAELVILVHDLQIALEQARPVLPPPTEERERRVRREQ